MSEYLDKLRTYFNNKIAELEKKCDSRQDNFNFYRDNHCKTHEKLENDLVYLREGHSNHLQRHNEEISELRHDFNSHASLIIELREYLKSIESDWGILHSELKSEFERCMKDITLSFKANFKEKQNIKSVLKGFMKSEMKVHDLSKEYNYDDHIKFLKNLLKQLDGEKDCLPSGSVLGFTQEQESDQLNNSKPSEPFELIEKFIPPRNIRCKDCMANPIPAFLDDLDEIKKIHFDWDDYKKMKEKWQKRGQ